MALAMGATLLAGCSYKGPDVADAWVRLPAVPGRPAVAYATITGGHDDTVLTAITSPDAGPIELHRSMAAGHGMVSMTPIARLPVPHGETVTLAPGGLHAMMFNLNPQLKPGGSVKLVVKFDGVAQTVEARLVGAGDPAP
jgi:copper(I)-binding protein